MTNKLVSIVCKSLTWCLNLLNRATITRLLPVLGLLLLLAAPGCGRDDDCKGGYWYCELTSAQDEDHDGTSLDYDCAPGNADIGAIYIGRDRDFDGFATTEDYGPALGCVVPEGFSDVFGDCDDTDPAKIDIFPWWVDLDGDGWGTGESAEICASTDGYALQGGDCDDADADINPEAAEVAEDGVDNDCDGRADDSAPEGSYTTSDATVTLDGSGDDEFSYSFAEISDFDAQGGTDLAVGSPGAENSGGEAVGAVDILAGPILSAEDLEGQVYTRLWGADEDDRAGAAVAGLGDIDGDGEVDLIVGAPGVETTSGWGGASGPEGAAYVVYGPVEPGSTVMLEDSRHVAILSASESGGRLGTSVAGIGDYTGDGLPDFAVGAPYTGAGGRWSDQPAQAGMVYLLSDLPGRDQEIGDVAFASLEGEEEYGWLGATVAGGKDLNGDGTPDLVVGAPTDRALGRIDSDDSHHDSKEGTAWILLEPLSDVATISLRASTWVMGPPSSGLGGAMTLVDDLNSDGYADLVLGAPFDDTYADDGGAVYLLSGGALEDMDPGEVAGSAALLGVVEGQTEASYLGWALADAGDIDEDGRTDLLCGAPGSESGKGEAWLLTDAAGGDQLADAMWNIAGPFSYGWTGRTLGAADLNGLGRPDIFVGAVEDGASEFVESTPGYLSLILTDGL